MPEVGSVVTRIGTHRFVTYLRAIGLQPTGAIHPGMRGAEVSAAAKPGLRMTYSPALFFDRRELQQRVARRLVTNGSE